MNTTTIYEKVKQTLLKGLQTKGLEWFKPWNTTGQSADWRPIKWVSGKGYNGVNVFMLTAIANQNGWVNQWLTFAQCAKAGGKVLYGNKASYAYYWEIGWWNPATKKSYKTLQQAIDAGENQDDLKKYIILKAHNVFSVSQTTLEPREVKKAKVTPKDFNPVAEAEAIVAGYKTRPNINHGGDRAYYSPLQDYVQMPNPESFVDGHAYYKTLFHELAHSTGHKDRLNRKGVGEMGVRFGDAVYSAEELVAESSAMMLAGIAGIDTHTDNSIAYIQAWVKGVQETPATAVVSALTQSAKVVDYILGE